MKATQEERTPYLLASCDASGRRYRVCTLDKSAAGYIPQNAEGQWEIEDQHNPHFPAFAARDEAVAENFNRVLPARCALSRFGRRGLQRRTPNSRREMNPGLENWTETS